MISWGRWRPRLDRSGTAVAPHQAAAARTPPILCGRRGQPLLLPGAGNTEDTWNKVFAAKVRRYSPAGFDFYSGGAIRLWDRAIGEGTFIADRQQNLPRHRILSGMQSRFGAAGDFARPTSSRMKLATYPVPDRHAGADRGGSSACERAGQRGAGQGRAAGGLLPGVWAANAKSAQGQPCSIRRREEGMRAAEAIATTRCSARRRGGSRRKVSRTHVGAAHAWLRTRAESGDPATCTRSGSRDQRGSA